MRVVACFLAIWTCLAGASLADDPPVVRTSLKFVPARIKAGSAVVAVLTIRVLRGHHINVHRPPLKDLVPTRLTLGPADGLKLVRIDWPPGHVVKMPFAERPMPFYDGTVVVAVHFKVPADARPGRRTVKARLHYQACDQTSCLMPESLAVAAAVDIVK
jgi:DsbC/DsbD-like thiol-disulfide interchange protein